MKLSKRRYLLLGGALLMALVVAGATLIDQTDPVTLPTGTAIQVQLDHALASNQNQSGQEFKATVSKPVVFDGKTVIPEGAEATGRVVEARESGRLMGRARLRLELVSLQVDGKSYDIDTAAASRAGGSHKKRNWWLIGGGGAGGAAIGAIAAGGKGALIGGPVGAGAGTAVAYFTRKKDVRLPAETRLTFSLAQPVTIDVKG